MSEFLSQDDIDALLQGGFGDEGESGSSDGGGSSDVLPLVATDLGEQMVSVLNTLVGREVTVTSQDTFIGDEQMVVSNLGEGEYLSIELPLTGDISGVLFITMLKSKAAILSDLMLMGDGTAPYDDDVKDGISEIYSQVLGSFASLLREKSSQSASPQPVVVHDNDNISTLIGEESINLEVTITDIDPFAVIATFDDAIMRTIKPHYEEAQAPAAEESQDDNSLDMAGLLSQDEIDSITAAAEDMSVEPAPQQEYVDDTVAPVFTSSMAPKGSVDMLLDIELEVSIELGRTDISIKRVLELAPGALVELDRLAGEPVDLMVNSKVVAKGEVVVVDESFGVRILSLVSPEERIKSLR